jgi:hypothetical protein
MAKKVKSFNKFKNEQNAFDRHTIWIKTVKLCEDKLLKAIDESELSEMPEVIINIVTNTEGMVYENGILLVYDYVKKRKEPFIRFHSKEYHGLETAYYPATKDEVKEAVSHFCGYYLLDDGEVSLIDGEISFAEPHDSYFDDNITQTGMALWILEQLGFEYPCVILYKDKVEWITLFDVDSFSEGVTKLKQYVERMGIDKRNCRMDMVSVTGKLGIYIVPKNILTLQ